MWYSSLSRWTKTWTNVGSPSFFGELVGGASGDGSVTSILTSFVDDERISAVILIKSKMDLKNLKKNWNSQTKAFLFKRKALWAENPLSSGGFFLTKLVALFDFGVLTGVVILSSLVCNETRVPLGVILLLMTDGDVKASSTASWCLKKKL